MTEIAVLVVHGEITEVTCHGEVTEANGVTTTPYLATLTIDSVTKPEGDDTGSVELPFASVVIDESANVEEVSCGWSPSYALGQKGTFYLTTNDETEYYSLVTWSAFIADDDSKEEAPPTCESAEPEPEPEPDTTASDDAGSATSGEPSVGPGDTTASDDDAAPAEPSTDATEEDGGGCASGGSGSPLGLMLLSLFGLLAVSQRKRFVPPRGTHKTRPYALDETVVFFRAPRLLSSATNRRF